MFMEAYVSALKHYKRDGWYQDTDIFSGQPQNFQFTSLQGFWPGWAGPRSQHFEALVPLTCGLCVNPLEGGGRGHD